MKKVDTAISQVKRKLMNTVKEKGIYENFGQEEIRKIKDKFVDITDYSEDMNKVRNKITLFEEWCMTYNGVKEEQK